MIFLLILIYIFDGFNAIRLYDDEESTYKPHIATFDAIDFEPFVPLSKDKEKLVIGKNINCDDYSKYVLNCTLEAALIYNSTRKSPPMPAKVEDWCRAIRYQTNCAIDWNSDCKDVTENHFNEEGIKGHMHVLRNVCDAEWFRTQYDDLPQCIESATEAWETCYTIFEAVVNDQKNTTHEWTHYETHFYLCCARAQFRRCTLTALFQSTPACPYTQAVTLQKFSVVISEGDVFQDCDHNMMYPNCPGGDPRPNEKTLNKLLNVVSLATKQNINNLVIYYLLINNILL